MDGFGLRGDGNANPSGRNCDCGRSGDHSARLVQPGSRIAPARSGCRECARGWNCHRSCLRAQGPQPASDRDTPQRLADLEDCFRLRPERAAIATAPCSRLLHPGGARSAGSTPCRSHTMAGRDGGSADRQHPFYSAAAWVCAAAPSLRRRVESRSALS